MIAPPSGAAHLRSEFSGTDPLARNLPQSRRILRGTHMPERNDTEAARTSHEETHDEMQECIEECLNCHAVCTMTAQYCMTEGGEHAERRLVTMRFR